MERAKKFGTFGGVFTPALLTIISVIMYLRLGWIVGQVGLLYTIGIILVANIIAITTGLSLSSIATDKKIKAGGVYYMLSRSLGLPIGGAIGATIYLAFSLSIALNIIGFSESFLSLDYVKNVLELEPGRHAYRIVGIATLMVLTTIAFISTSLAIKIQYFVLTAIGLSLLAIIFGLVFNTPSQTEGVILFPNENAPSLAVIFAVFFPAATGFMMGASMSGDLKDPKASIPKGTMMAIFIGMIINILMATGFAFFVDRQMLLTDSGFLSKVAITPILVIAGIWGATLSTALSSILGGPRVIQAMAKDRLAPHFLSKGYGINNEPHRAIVISFSIAFLAILIGDLNTIARIATMFFITAYGFINLAFALESWASTDFRPSFRIPRWVGWLGFAASIIVMMQIDFFAMVIAAILIWLVWFAMKSRDQKLEPGDVWQSVWTSVVRQSLHNLYTKGIEERNWKPNIMLFTGNPHTREQLKELGKALIANHGLLTIINLQQYKEGEKTRPRSYQKQLAPDGLVSKGVFTQEYYCHDIYDGIRNLAGTYGFAGVEPNTVLMGWSRKRTDMVKFARLINHIVDLDLNILLMDYDIERGFGKRNTIDIWWKGSGNNGNLAINLVKFLWLSEGWKESRLRLMIENPVNEERENIFIFAREVLDNLRVNAEIVIINNEIEKKPFYDIIRIESSESDIIFLGMPDIEPGNEQHFVENTHKLCEDLGTVVLIKASTQFKRLNIGLKTSAAPSMQNSIETHSSMEKKESVKISWPKKEPLAVAVQEFSSQTHDLCTEMVQKSFGKVLSQYAEVIDQALSRVDSTFFLIEKKLPEIQTQSNSNNKTLYKLSNNTYSRYEQILNNLKNNLLAEQEKNLSVFFTTLEEKILQVINKQPEIIEVLITQDELRNLNGKGAGLKLLRLKMRLTASKQVKASVRFRKIIRHFYPGTCHLIKRKLWNNFSSLSRQYLFEQQAVFKDFRDSLQKIENAANTGVLTREMIEIERAEVHKQFSTLKEYLFSVQQNLSGIAVEDNLRVLQKISDILDTANPNAACKKEKLTRPMRKHELRAMDSFPAEWLDHQRSNINQHLLEITLSAIEYKLWHYIVMTLADLRRIKSATGPISVLQLPPLIIDFINQGLEKPEKITELQVPEFPASQTSELSRKIKEIEDYTQEQIFAAISRIPGQIELLKTESEADFTETRLTFAEKQTVEVSRLVHFIIQNDLISPLQAELKTFTENITLTQQEIQEIVRLIRITLTPDKEEPLQMPVSGFLEEQRVRTEKVQEQINTLFAGTEDKLNSSLNKTARQLSLSAFLKTAANLRLLEKTYDADKEKVSWFKQKHFATKDFFRKHLIRLWYDRSKRIVYAHQTKSAEAETSFPISRMHELNEMVSVKDSVLAAIPPYYQQLFLRKNNYFMDFWYGKPRELEEARKTIARHEKGYSGALMFRGEHNSGKTFFVNYVVHKFLEKRPVYALNPPFAGSASEADFLRALQKATENFVSADKILRSLPDKSVVIIEDLELWWEKTIKGLKVIKLICSLIEKHGDRILFIITVNSHAYRSVNRFLKIDSFLLSTIDCHPFNAEELRHIIMQRHRSGNMQFVLDNKKETDMRSWDLARLFNTYFNYTKGNVGLTLQTWMSSIKEVNDNTLTISLPVKPDTTVLNKLNSETLVFLVQFILHKRLNAEKIQRIMMMNATEVQERIRLLKRAAIITEPNQGVYTLNPNLHAFIRARFIEKELL
ncbi:MAG: hypothetical protein EA361_04970 [Bacteroidetes bacterium]|nr:MAG: hypothetical protein EA361_04970 [Bacteroidota bacterium]